MGIFDAIGHALTGDIGGAIGSLGSNKQQPHTAPFGSIGTEFNSTDPQNVAPWLMQQPIPQQQIMGNPLYQQTTLPTPAQQSDAFQSAPGGDIFKKYQDQLKQGDQQQQLMESLKRRLGVNPFMRYTGDQPQGQQMQQNQGGTGNGI